MHVGAVAFEDATRLYLIYDSVADAARRPLFPTEVAARNWLEQGMPIMATPHEADTTEKAVTIISDVALERSGEMAFVVKFASRASKQALWLTGPRSFLELVYENGATASRTE